MTFIYTDKEMKKIRIIQKLIDWVISIQDASVALNCSERTIYRYQATFLTEWPPWFIHGLKGKPSNHNPNTSKFASIFTIISAPKFKDFWPTLLSEKLEEIYGIIINKESLRQRMIKQGLRVPNKRKITIARQKRERRPSFGMLIQMDWSYHDRLENWEKRCLLCAVDDATSNVVESIFAKWESLEDIFEFRKEYLKKHGKPQAIYLDSHSTYKVNHPKDQFDKDMKTRFQRAMEKLGIIVIYSKQPEGKWRVERGFWTHQDRLIKEMRLADIKNYDQANKFLKYYYIKKHNAKFGVPAKEPWNYHTKITKEELVDLEWVFAKNTDRTLRRDGTITYMNTTYQILKDQHISWYTLTIKESMYGHIKIFSWAHELQFTKLVSR